MKIYKILNKLFGWDYIYHNAGVLGANGSFRVFKTLDGRIAFWKYDDYLHFIKDPSEVVWLTCKPSKYFDEVSEDE